MTTRIQTENYTRITRSYLTDVIEPALEEIRKKSAPTIRRYKIADTAVELTSYVPALSTEFARAFAHLPTPSPSENELTVYMWDTLSTGVKMMPPWNTPGHHSLATHVSQQTEDGFVGIYMHYDDTMSLYDPLNKRAYFWIYDASQLPVWVRAAPLRTLLQWILEEKDIHLLHGAAVAEASTAVLLTAKGGSGKSTTALSCLRLGMQYLADDYVAVSQEKDPRAYSLYNSIKVAPHDSNKFDLSDVAGAEGEKSVVFLSSLFPNQMLYSAPLKAIMIPTLTGGVQTTIVPASKAQAMLALLPTTLFQLPLARSHKMKALSTIISSLPCYFLELGEDHAQAAHAVQSYIREHL